MKRSLRLGALVLAGWFSATSVLPSLAQEAAPATVATPDKTTPSDAAALKPDQAKEKAEQDQEYYELLQLFADTLDQVERNYVKDVSKRELMEAAIRGMMGKLDQHSNYIAPEDMERFKADVENEFGGVGIQVSTEGGQLRVISPIYGTPAYRAGILAGDRIVKIEDKPTRGMKIDDCVKALKGKIGTSVNVTVEHDKDGKQESVKLTRELVKVETVLGDTRNTDDTWNFFYDQEKKIGYVRITSFGRHTTEDLAGALKKLSESGLRGLILDLRFNPGGLLSSAIEISDLFVAEGAIVSTEGRNTPKRSWTARKPGTYEGFPVAILVNHYSASASEIVSACLQDHDRAIVVGERTYGKGSVQNIIHVEEGKSAIKLTTAGYHRPNGKNIHRFEGASDTDEWGVKPSDGYDVKLTDEETAELVMTRRDRDIIRKPDSEEKAPELKDKQLAKALDYITGKLAGEPKTDEAKPESEMAKKEGAE